jgi:hypothetical protein
MMTKSPIFWNVTPGNLVAVHQHFRGTYCLQFQGKREGQARSRQQAEQIIFRKPERHIDKTMNSKCSEQTNRIMEKSNPVALKRCTFVALRNGNKREI